MSSSSTCACRKRPGSLPQPEGRLGDGLVSLRLSAAPAPPPPRGARIYTRRPMSRSRDEPVRLTKIYTRGGDKGETSRGDGKRVPKTDLRIAAYGTVDELNSLLGLALASDDLPDEFRPWLEQVQNDLFDVGADLSVPLTDERERLRVQQSQVDRLEELCDRVNERLEPLKSFVLPGGGEAAARLHVARTVCRRAERDAVALARGRGCEPGGARLSEPALRPALHPRPGRGERRGAALEAWRLALAAAASFGAGVLGGAVGLVLGSLRLPAVILASGSAATAAGTNIAVSAASALTGGIAHARAGRVDWRIAAWMTPPSVAAAFLGGYFGGRVPETLLLGGIAAALLWNGVQLALRDRRAAQCPQPRARSRRRGRGHRPDRRGGRSHPRDAANAGAARTRRSSRGAGGRDEPRRRLLPRPRGLRGSRRAAGGRLAGARRQCGRRCSGSLARRPADRPDVRANAQAGDRSGARRRRSCDRASRRRSRAGCSHAEARCHRVEQALIPEDEGLDLVSGLRRAAGPARPNRCRAGGEERAGEKPEPERLAGAVRVFARGEALGHHFTRLGAWPA